MSDAILRTIEPHQRAAVLDLLAGWLNDRAFFARYFEHDPTFRDPLLRRPAAGGEQPLLDRRSLLSVRSPLN